MRNGLGPSLLKKTFGAARIETNFKEVLYLVDTEAKIQTDRQNIFIIFQSGLLVFLKREKIARKEVSSRGFFWKRMRRTKSSSSAWRLDSEAKIWIWKKGGEILQSIRKRMREKEWRCHIKGRKNNLLKKGAFLKNWDPNPYPKVRCWESITGGHVVGGRGVRVEGVDVGQEGAHLSGHAGTQVFGRKAVKVSERRSKN